MRKIRWGVLSTARIATQKVIPAMQVGEHTDVTAIASRRLENARSTAAHLGIPKAYGSYEELLEDPDVDAIYNPLPNHLHVPWSIRALEAGKHVLCEKPIALTSAEARVLLEAAAQRPHLKVMEAFMYRHHIQWQHAVDLLASGGVGELRTIHSVFSYHNVDPANIRNQAEIGGGALMDIGCYSISLSRLLFGAEPQRVCGIADVDSQFGTDRLTAGMLDFGMGTATFTCSTQLAGYQRVNVFGTEGRVEIETPFNPPPEQPSRIWHHREGKMEEFVLPPCNQFTRQGDLFALAILNRTAVPTPLKDAVDNMRAIEAVAESARRGEWVSV